MAEFGKLEKVDVRKGWETEPAHFTPWLAKEENLRALGEVIDMDLEAIETESSVGSYRLDLLAREEGTNDAVVIENQFGTTDHSHLGQLLTYASGVGEGAGAKTVIWIAEKFSDPHRAALDWLNKVTEPGIRFFAVEIQLWRIGDSPFAPMFNLVSKPNDWQKKVTQDTSGKSETQQLYLEFCEAFIAYCQANKTSIRFPNAWARHWLPTPIGRVGCGVNFTISKIKKKMGCELYLSGPQAKSAFSQLLADKSAITSALGESTLFDELPEKAASRLVEYREADINARNTWPELHKWLKDKGEAHTAFFTPRIKQLQWD
jgi:hypothetical protein